LFGNADGCFCCCIRALFSSEVALVPQIAVEDAGQLSCFGAEGGASTFEEEDGHDAAILRVSIRGEPAEAGAIVRAGAGLAHYWELVEIGAERTGSAVLDGSMHAILNFRDELTDIESALDARLEVGNFFRRGWVLQIEECSPIGDRSD